MNKSLKLKALEFINTLQIGDKVVSYDSIYNIETIYSITNEKLLKQVHGRLKRDILVFNHTVKAYEPIDGEKLDTVITVRKTNLDLAL